MRLIETQIESDGLVNKISEVLSQRILVGGVKSGDRLRQDGLAYEFGVSQGTIREVFRKLEGLRLIESLPRRGVRVTEVAPAGEREIAGMRAALEVLAVRSIARPVPVAHLRVLRETVKRGDTADNLYDCEAANRDFHVMLAEPCNMPRLLASIAELNLAYSRHVFASAGEEPWKPRYNFDHWRIYEAYAIGDLEQVASLLTRHVNAVERVRWSKRKM